jgi:hypothetical protein
MTIAQKVVGSLAVVILLLIAVAFAQEEREKEIQQSALPPAVQKTVAQAKGGRSITGFSRETENGQTVYEAKFRTPGVFIKNDKSVTVAADGSIIEVEEWISRYAVPRNVLLTLKAEAGGGKIVKFKTITKNGALVAYEAKVMKNGKKSGIQVSPDGQPLDHEE